MTKRIFFIGLLIVSSFSCKKEVEEEPNGFNKKELLRNLTDNIIVPTYLSMEASIVELQNAWTAFTLTQNASNLDDFKVKWLNSNLIFQKAKMFHFGPGLNHGLRAAYGTFPTDTSKVLNLSAQTNPDVYILANIDAIGYPAIEFLVYRPNAFSLLSGSPTQRQFITVLLDKMKYDLDNVLDDWTTSYATQFKQSTGTSSTSGFSLLINAFNLEYELAKNAKLGIPIGNQSLGIAQPQYAEAPYSGKSLLLLEENLKFIKAVFQGVNDAGSDGKSFADYLVSLNKQSLRDEILNEINGALSDFDNLSDNLVVEIQNQPATLDALYTKLQNLVVHFKTDMTSAFGVLITYQDNDGD